MLPRVTENAVAGQLQRAGL